MRSPFLLLLLAALALAHPGCGLLNRRRTVDPDAAIAAKSRRPLHRVGVVTLVNAEEGFALIDSASAPVPAIGAQLQSYTGPTASAQLRASDVRRHPFIVADIVGGTPRAGDEVFEAVRESGDAPVPRATLP